MTLEDAGYTWQGMKIVTEEEALFAWGQDKEVYCIHIGEDAESLIENREDIKHIDEQYQVLAIEKENYTLKDKAYEGVYNAPIRQLVPGDEVYLSLEHYPVFNHDGDDVSEDYRKAGHWCVVEDSYLEDDEEYGYPKILFVILTDKVVQGNCILAEARELDIKKTNKRLVQKDASMQKQKAPAMPII